MLSWLRAYLAPKAPPNPAAPSATLLDAVAALERRVNRMETERLDLLTEWSKTRDQVIRYMKRVGQVRVREEAAAGEEPLDDFDQLDLEVLRQKFGGPNGRG